MTLEPPPDGEPAELLLELPALDLSTAVPPPDAAGPVARLSGSELDALRLWANAGATPIAKAATNTPDSNLPRVM